MDVIARDFADLRAPESPTKRPRLAAERRAAWRDDDARHHQEEPHPNPVGNTCFYVVDCRDDADAMYARAQQQNASRVPPNLSPSR